jgi:hypothetical protein
MLATASAQTKRVLLRGKLEDAFREGTVFATKGHLHHLTE